MARNERKANRYQPAGKKRKKKKKKGPIGREFAERKGRKDRGEIYRASLIARDTSEAGLKSWKTSVCRPLLASSWNSRFCVTLAHETSHCSLPSFLSSSSQRLIYFRLPPQRKLFIFNCHQVPCNFTHRVHRYTRTRSIYCDASNRVASF